MPRTYRIALLGLLLSILLPSGSLATPRGIIFSEGNKPSRTVYVAEFLDIYDRTNSLNALINDKNGEDFEKLLKQQKQVEMRIVAVYENKNAPESTDMTVEFMCSQKQYRIVSAHSMIRDGSEKYPTHDWKPYSDAKSTWPMMAAEIACENERIKNAANVVAASKNGQDFSALEKLGIFYIGDPDRLETVDKVWQTFLVDGKRPAYADKKLTDAEVATYNKKMDQSLANAKKTNKAGIAMANAELGKIKDEREFKQEIAQNNKKHTDLFGRESKQYKQLKWLTGKTEKDIVRKAGAPTNVIEAGDARFLTYYNEYFIPGVGYYLDNNGNEIYGGTAVTCELKIELRQSRAKVDFRAVDYQIDATNGGCRDLSWFNQFAR